jgi:hypothetical protein
VTTKSDPTAKPAALIEDLRAALELEQHILEQLPPIPQIKGVIRTVAQVEGRSGESIMERVRQLTKNFGNVRALQSWTDELTGDLRVQVTLSDRIVTFTMNKTELVSQVMGMMRPK